MPHLKSSPCAPCLVASRSVGVAMLVVCAALAPPCPGATSIQNFAAASNDRFANNAAFVGGGVDWSGVGRSSDGHWGTLLTSNVFVSAYHYHPGVGSVLDFFPGNDPGGPMVARAVAGGQRIGTSDLWVGYLATAVPSTITNYAFCQTALTETNFAASALADLPVFMGGITPTASGYGAVSDTVQTVGTNRLEGFYEHITVDASTGDVLVTVQNQPGDAAFGFTSTGYEAQLQGGDSGSPLMSVAGGKLVLAGIAWAIGPDDIDPDPANDVERMLSAFTYTGSYAAQLMALVPEPGVPLLVLISGTLLVLRRRTASLQTLTCIRTRPGRGRGP